MYSDKGLKFSLCVDASSAGSDDDVSELLVPRRLRLFFTSRLMFNFRSVQNEWMNESDLTELFDWSKQMQRLLNWIEQSIQGVLYKWPKAILSCFARFLSECLVHEKTEIESHVSVIEWETHFTRFRWVHSQCSQSGVLMFVDWLSRVESLGWWREGKLQANQVVKYQSHYQFSSRIDIFHLPSFLETKHQTTQTH